MVHSFKERIKYLYLILGIGILDQGTKWIIKSVFSGNKHQTIAVFDDLLNIIYTENRGAVWGLFPALSEYITIISLIALIVIIIYFLKINIQCKLELVALSFIIGGALGNNFDRIFQGYVVDFIDVSVKSFHWATFNIADSCISIGVALMVIAVIRNKCPKKEAIRKENASDIN